MTTNNREKPDSIPPDQKQRDIILTELDSNMLVEAAAGTGKTTSMLGRMIALIRTGKCKHIRLMAAVTFTRKAAAELRERFQIQLETSVREAKGEERANLEKALGNIEQCFIGTIHSFCGRLLRERPVEAKVDIGFTEIDEDADMRLRNEAWNEYGIRLLSHDPDGVLRQLDQINIPLTDLEDAFIRFADFPDVSDWAVPDKDMKLPDFKDAVHAVRQYVTHMEQLAPLLPNDYGNDTLIPEIKQLPRIVSHYANLSDPSQLIEVLEHFNKKAKIIQKIWMKDNAFSKEQAKAEHAKWERFREETVKPALAAWCEYRYGPVINVLTQARNIYDTIRQERGLLNYQDLLIKAADVLRYHPNVRKYFKKRFTHLLIDEFQDTDPVQAEVMLLLTASNIRQTHWQLCSPVPGSLFVVGDPKQSIYRFRRADIVTYNEVKKIIQQSGSGGKKGRLVQLQANFRTVGSIIDWVNEVFEPKDSNAEAVETSPLRFSRSDSDASPAYVSLLPGRIDDSPGEFTGIHVLNVPAEFSTNDEVVLYEADCIARVIRYALDARTNVPRTQQQLKGGKAQSIDPSDFMIVTNRKRNLSVFARKLQEYGIPNLVTGGTVLNEVKELKLLYLCLWAVIHPDNPVALLSALRSELFGISDAGLYAYKKAGGEFSYNASIPVELPGEHAETFRDTFTRLKRYAGWLSQLPPMTAVEKIVADPGLMILAAARPGGDMEAGSFAKALEILRAMQSEIWTVMQLVEYLGVLIDNEAKGDRYDGISVRSEELPVVRIMNLHKVKGLEAPVVFLADSTGEFKHKSTLHIDRIGDNVRGYMSVPGKMGGYHPPMLAHPADWEEIREKEELFLQAELKRLQYVAATRAGSVLIITQRAKSNHRNPWRCFKEALSQCPEIPDPGPQSAPVRKKKSISTDDVSAALKNINERYMEIGKKSYHVFGAKGYALSTGVQSDTRLSVPEESGIQISSGDGETGAEWGTVIHFLLQRAMESPEADLRRIAETALPEQGFTLSHAEAAVDTVRSVMKAEVWQRALQSKQRLIEVPFQVMLNENDPAPTIIRGVIDLIFPESDGWVLVDYKTDYYTGKIPDGLVKKYIPQLKLYAEAWKKCTGKGVKETALYFTRTNHLVSVPIE